MNLNFIIIIFFSFVIGIEQTCSEALVVERIFIVLRLQSEGDVERHAEVIVAVVVVAARRPTQADVLGRVAGRLEGWHELDVHVVGRRLAGRVDEQALR